MTRLYTPEETALLAPYAAAPRVSGKDVARLADQLGRSMQAIGDKLRDMRRGKQKAPPATIHRVPKPAMIQATPEPVIRITRKCLMCRGPFDAPTRFIFRCETCRKSIAGISPQYDATSTGARKSAGGAR